ncbi:DUF3533 domain-containing protein [Gordonia neofelifaecis]|uniref:DUF3533 domain-containing protein n=1 Tax=Gordonia neofelifaecis NRRL B-59395 TaxID=644548 RepID=F1YI03_9ACTN|nr:DUF3533 domain-containing protein [Gordonia neofelifaecis]EGD55557.1 hypothetical protein SCNU_07588 [Gordonia neofelifaecis NRRL B-59395]
MDEEHSEPSESTSEKGRALRSWRLWLSPVILVTLVMSAMAALYLSSILDPNHNLRAFPIAVVNEDVGATDPTGAHVNFGDEMQTTVESKVDATQVRLENLSRDEMTSRMRDGKLYGAITVPADFTAKTMALAQASLGPSGAQRPQVTVLTNPRSGTLGSSLVTSMSSAALAEMNKTLGARLTESVNGLAAQQRPPAQVSGAAAMVLAQPIDIVTVPFEPLPAHTGLGLSAFYYALLVLLAGFTGAMLVNTLVDGSLGFVASEIGPRMILRRSLGLNRLQALLIKWGVMVATSVVVSTAYLGIASALDMPVEHRSTLWAYSTLAIIAVGITALSVVSAFGGIGMLINMFVFVFLGLPSAGATIPLEAAPRAFAWLSSFEPLHQVYLGVRAILYFDARGSAGLTHAVIMTLIGLAVGVAMGLGTAYYYERKGLPRLTVHDLAQERTTAAVTTTDPI